MSATMSEQEETQAEPVAEPDQPDQPDQPEQPDQPDQPDIEPGEPEPEQEDHPDEQEEQAVVQPSEGLSVSPETAEKLPRSLERKAANWMKAVADYAEETGAPLLRCGLCDADPGFPGYLIHPALQPLTGQQVKEARLLLGDISDEPFEQDPEAQTCSRCKGRGRVSTGSKVEGERDLPCRVCKGKGWTGERANISPQEAAHLQVVDDTYQHEQGLGTSSDDAWGTPKEHPDWGKSPQYRTPGWQGDLEAWKAQRGYTATAAQQ